MAEVLGAGAALTSTPSCTQLRSPKVGSVQRVPKPACCLVEHSLASRAMTVRDVALFVVAFIFPPVAVRPGAAFAGFEGAVLLPPRRDACPPPTRPPRLPGCPLLLQVLIARDALDSYFWLNLLLTLLAWLPGVAHAIWVLCSRNQLGEWRTDEGVADKQGGKVKRALGLACTHKLLLPPPTPCPCKPCCSGGGGLRSADAATGQERRRRRPCVRAAAALCEGCGCACGGCSCMER